MGDMVDVRAPQLWRRPHAKIYGYNQDFSANYYSVKDNETIFEVLMIVRSRCLIMSKLKAYKEYSLQNLRKKSTCLRQQSLL